MQSGKACPCESFESPKKMKAGFSCFHRFHDSRAEAKAKRSGCKRSLIQAQAKAKGITEARYSVSSKPSDSAHKVPLAVKVHHYLSSTTNNNFTSIHTRLKSSCNPTSPVTATMRITPQTFSEPPNEESSTVSVQMSKMKAHQFLLLLLLLLP